MSDLRSSDARSSHRNGSRPTMTDNHFDHNEPKTSSTSCFTRILQQWSWHCKMLIVLLEKLFEKFAWFVSKRPFHVIFTALFVAGLLTIGFIRLNAENNVKYLYLPENSQASRDIARAEEFGFHLDVRREEIIILPKQNKSVLSQECLSEMIDIHEKVIQIDGYNELCLRPDPTVSCVSTNLLELFNYNKDELYGIQAYIQMTLANDAFMMSNGKRLKDNFISIFGKNASYDSLDSTNALRTVYFMTEHYHGKEREDILKWESIFIRMISEISKNMTCAEVFYSAERSLDDSVTESTGSDIKFFSVTFTIMGIFSSVVNGRCADSRYGHQLLGFTALLGVYLGVTSAFGLLMFAGVPFVSMAGVLPFLVVSIGVDDVFIILHELNELVRENLPAAHMLSGTLARSGPTITMTTFTDLVAFAVSCRSLFPAVRFFCAYAALAILFAFLMLVTFFVGCMWFDIKRVKAVRRDCVPCFMGHPPRKCCYNIRRNALDNVMKAWGRLLTSTPGKIAVCVFSGLFLAGAISGALHVDESFSRQLLTTKDSHFRKFLDVFEHHFHLNIEVNLVVPVALDYSKHDIQQKYLELENIAKSNKYFTQETSSWLSEFLKWARAYKMDISNSTTFHKQLIRFLSWPEYRRFIPDLAFSQNKTHLIASRISVFSKSNPKSDFQRDMMITIRKDLSLSSDLDVFAVSPPFIYFEQYAHILDETIRNLVIAGISILFISTFFLNHPMIILCLLCGFVALIVELLALMYLWDVSVNSISMIILVMALGFSVDYNAHVAYHFVSSKANTPDERVVDALGRVGGSVFLGGLSTFLGMMTTGLASSIVFQTFFKMFVGIVVLGLLHGLVILPVYLSILGKVFDLRVEEASFEILLKKWHKWKKSEKALSPKEKDEKSFHLPITRKFSSAAVVGIACRFPGGANSKDEFWNMLVEGRCGITSFPSDRPDAKQFEDCYNPGKNAPGKHYVLTGAFLENITGFDAQFFGISSAESRAMDPQQRLLLQVVYEAIEDAGLRLKDLQQCKTGVYVGLMNLDYGSLLMHTSNIRKIDQFASTGSTASVAANRISFALNFTGPSITMDTACSSSLTALHVAFGHLQTGECDVAIVCAPNILLCGRSFHVACCRAGMLAQDGRCKSFDIKGDGYGRGEGIAAVVLKASTTAIQDRDDIYAEIIASGLNNDGQSAIPMTSPSEVTQVLLGQRVLRESGLSKDDIQYVEAHGTGTAIGDVVEMGSISAIYGNSSRRVLRLGSVKSNINHTESTAGLAGLIKTCLMIKHEHFVPTINVQEVKPQLKMTERKMKVQVCNEPWIPEDDKPRTAAVCSYGYGGANAHLILQEVVHKPVPIIPSRSRLNRIMTLSAPSFDGLTAMAGKVSRSLQIKPDDDELLKDNICYSLNERYTVHAHRLAVCFQSLKEASKALHMFAHQEKGWQQTVVAGDATVPRKKVAFLYGGQGSQWYSMAKEMMMYEPTFKESVESVDRILKRQGVSWSLLEELNQSEETSRMNENPVGQTALFAVHYALTELLKSWGVVPSAVIGHSLGEISAACASGAISLSEAVQLVLIRSRLHEGCSPSGCMAATGMSQEDANSMLQHLQLDSKVDVAVVNSPVDVVLSGDREAVQRVENYVRAQQSNVFWKTLGTTRAFHSHEMEEIKRPFMHQAGKIKLRPCIGQVPLYSTVTGTQVSGKALSCDHWWSNLRQTVLFSPAMKNMFSDGYRTFVEINPSPQLSRYVQQIWSSQKKARTESDNDVLVIETLPRRSTKEQHRLFLHNCVAHLFTLGVPLSWNRIQGSGSKSFIRRPTYPWQESQFWYRDGYPADHVTPLGEKSEFAGEEEDGEKRMSLTMSHPLLGDSVPTEAFSGLHAWESELELHKVPYLKDHLFAESPHPIVPAAVYIEMMLAMVLNMFPKSTPEVRNITFSNMLTISTNDSIRTRTRLHVHQNPTAGSHCLITRIKNNDEEVILSEGLVSLDVTEECINSDVSSGTPKDFESFQTLKSRMVKRPQEYLQERQNNMGFQFGAQFNLITEAWSSDDETLATIQPTHEICNESSNYVVHPSIIDACFQSLLLVKLPEGKFVPYRIDGLTILRREISGCLFVHSKAVHHGREKRFNITLMDCQGRAIMLVKGFLGVDLSALEMSTNFENTSFKLQWKEEPLANEIPAESPDQRTWLILQDKSGYAQRLVEQLPEDETVTLLNMHGSPDETRDVLSKSLKEALRKHERVENAQKLLIVNFWPVDATRFGTDTENFDSSHFLAFESSLLLVQEVLKKESIAKESQLVFVTSGVVSIADSAISAHGGLNPSEPTFPWSSTMFGFRRTFSEELSSPKASVIDLSVNPSFTELELMLMDLRQVTVSEEIAYRNGLRYVNQLTRLKSCEIRNTKLESSVTKSGYPKPFKLSFVSDKRFLRGISGVNLGGERPVLEVFFACPVLNTGRHNLTSHDRLVIAGKLQNITDGCQSAGSVVVGTCKAENLGNYVVPEECGFTKVSEDMTAQQAAALCFPMAMSYDLITDILVDAKEKNILVYHDKEEISCVFACVAFSLNASVVCVVKNRRSRNLLKDFGIPVVFTEDEVATSEAIHCVNLDAVCLLSRPRGKILENIMAQLKPGGKVITISDEKSSKITTLDLKKDVHFVMRTLGGLTDNLERFSELLASCTSVLVSSGFLQKLLSVTQESISIYDLVKSDGTPADKLLSTRNSELCFHTVSLRPKPTSENVEFYRLALDSKGFRRDRTYLVIGGIRGFGFEVARWMVENGAKIVMCTARSAPSEEKKAEVKRLEQQTGSRILLRSADVTSWSDMTVIKEELESLPSVAGIVFSAMVLEDQLIKEADLKTCHRVVSTKVKGSVLLHQLSLSMDLDFFIMFSSITGVLGNNGQVSYAAANSFLDYLCEYRSNKLGLPALSVNWGPIGGAGVLERFKDVAALLETQGFYPLHNKTALEFLKRILLEYPDEAEVCLCDMNWPVYLRTHMSPRLQLMRDEMLSSSQVQSSMTLKELALQPLEFRINYVQDFVKNLLASWSGADVNEVDLNVGLYKYGVDSIGAANMSIHIRNGLGASFETYYFIQPKTSGFTIINDVLEQIEKYEDLEEDSTTNDSKTLESVVDLSPLTDGKALSNNNDGKHDTEEDQIELEAVKINEKVIPLYVPDEAIIKVFMVHSSHKSALANAAFALGFQKQTLVAFYSVGLEDTRHHTSDYGTVQALSRRYLDLIQKEQPKGPYYLAGYSFGGTLIYEIASLLTEKDEEVAMVFMMDTNPWFPKALAYGRQFFLSKSEIFHHTLTQLVTRKMIHVLAYGRLGVTPKELDELREHYKSDEEIIFFLDEKAAAKGVPLHLHEEVAALQYQLKGAMEAHNDWEPPKVRYRGTLTFARCEETKIVPLFWDGPQTWKSLTGRMDLLVVPGGHVDQKDEVHGRLGGSLMMTTAAMKYRTKYSTLNLSGLRARGKERMVDWIKKGTQISMYSKKGSSTLLQGTLWLDNEETVLTFVSERLGFFKKKKVVLKELNNILPGKYVNAVQKNPLHKSHIELVVCLITTKGKQYNFVCSDWQQLNQLMESFDALFDIPFVKVHN